MKKQQFDCFQVGVDETPVWFTEDYLISEKKVAKEVRFMVMPHDPTYIRTAKFGDYLCRINGKRILLLSESEYKREYKFLKGNNEN